MAEPVFRALEILAKAAVAVTGTRITFIGEQNIPERGGAVIAMNHTSYVDWLPAAYAAVNRGRRPRFLIKAELQQVPLVNFVIKHARLIPVDRSAGADAYAAAVHRLRGGELIVVHPESTISRSFELREFKTGAARMAHDAGVPIIPLIVWGAQRIWTKDHPKSLGYNKFPVIVNIGAPIRAADTVERTQSALRQAMTVLLHQTQESYPHPAGAYWVPRRLGGSAPTLEEATAIEATERAERARNPVGRGRAARKWVEQQGKRMEFFSRPRPVVKARHGHDEDRRPPTTRWHHGDRSKWIA
ncbi:1-acyl-sn-glycerol-3-phosphate acyltransferase [Mycobacterium sp. SM1]|uniref:lysophospholipid acyltransferase family protein n=1 Tax=Mycobacterium sp. SM1 TaxID=2816243 RepID=UPI001BCB7880|nr:1-acyl-sn-glycerol-3-phosphate acyltransferase [Mycobacterium sp. SM1]MBS4728003.1 1-acyl-sn-glycerol-3-phosphate acyltransferase [Mycobacterium sp. SM1]